MVDYHLIVRNSNQIDFRLPDRKNCFVLMTNSHQNLNLHLGIDPFAVRIYPSLLMDFRFAYLDFLNCLIIDRIVLVPSSS